ncbi:TauD/TfdA family dioxygenase [Streptomyces sp. NPDC047017]|uniref:TauD/TfdA family dioxygenase n=1 Tax=Streptomyces sp. NPDC047017 TaxID=3155024 RepID=UPI0033D99687
MGPFFENVRPDSIPVERLVRPGEILARLAQYGIAIFHGLDSAPSLVALARTLGTALPHPDSDAHAVTVITEREAVAGRAFADGFSRAALAPHTDRADMLVPPGLLVNLCVVQAETGGESVFADGGAIYRLLAARAPEALQALSQPNAVAYGRSHVYAGPIFEPSGSGRRLRIRVWPPEQGRFSQAAEAALGELKLAIDAQALTIGLAAGQGYVVDNHRWLHGRRAYLGNRVMLRIGVEPHQGALLTGIPSVLQRGVQG